MLKKETIPLLHDHHSHPSQYGAFIDSADISKIRNKQKALSVINDISERGKVNVVLGWNNSYFTFTDEELEILPPVIICNISLHGFLYNEKAEEIVKEKHENTDILHKLKDSMWVEENLPQILKFLIQLEKLDKKKLNSLYNHLLENGIYRIEEMLLPSESCLEIFMKTVARDRTDFWADHRTYQALSEDARKKIKGIKIFADGAISMKTAAIKGNYTHGNNGVLLHSRRTLMELINMVDTEQIAVHAIGDRAIDMVVDTIEGNFKADNKEHPEFRLEHVQFISKSSAERARALGITLSMQPNFSLGSEFYSDRLSQKYQKINNPFRMLIDEIGFVPGKDLLFGSDGMPHGVKTALETSLFPPFLSQRLTLREFEQGYCVPDKKAGCIDIKVDESERRVFIDALKI